MSSLADNIVDAIISVTGSKAKGLHEPTFKGNEWEYLKACLDSSFVSSVGAFVDRFEQAIAEYTGSKYAIAVVNGTAALHIALLLAGVSEGDEVLIPSLSFVATANAVCYTGAIPHFVDSAEDNLGIAVDALRDYLKETTEQHGGQCVNVVTNRVIRVLVPMHTFGHPVDIEGLLSIAKDFNLILVEDAAEALGSFYQGRHMGCFGRLGTLSFNGNKTITTGGGGAILTDDAALAKRAKHLTTTAKMPSRWQFEHDEVGYNYRMPNINAALGCAQLEQLPTFLSSKRTLHEHYQAVFSRMPGVSLVTEPKDCTSNYWLQALLIDEVFANQRDEILEKTNKVGLMTRPVWQLLHRLRPFVGAPRAPLPVATSLERRLMNIPSSAFLV